MFNIESESLESADIIVGRNLRELRSKNRLSLRALAELSGLNINTLSLIENGKSSPSVSTLQRLAQALEVPIAHFFETSLSPKQIIFTPANGRPAISVGGNLIENLGKDLSGNRVQPFIITLGPGMGSGERTIIHAGYEFVYCISGSMQYWIEETEYILNPGDSLIFESQLPHSWMNNNSAKTQIILTIYPSDSAIQSTVQHFTQITQEYYMKIAIITDDGKTISQHFGRASYYLVLTILDGHIENSEMRPKIGHNQFSTQSHDAEAHGAGRGSDPASHNKHVSMVEAITDCKVLLCGGMGRGAYESLLSLNIQPWLTDMVEIGSAVQAYLDGNLPNQAGRLH
jgi:transcriptional regulator with XRE-family HTH domain/predicted Fe-Mo cluster-binding NifX family protein/mannose-6-phosphate isomerase-like protein (cupin superfamily)